MLQPGRSSSANAYRFGFNGMEMDNEAHNQTGTSYDFGNRSMYDPRVARFVTVDPDDQKYSGQSPYVYAANSPLYFIDQDGKGPIVPKSWWQGKGYQAGAAAGLVDGLWETLEMSFDVAIAYNISNPLYYSERAAQVRQDYSDLGKVLVKMTSDEGLRNKVWGVMTESLGNWWEEASFQGDPSDAGYQHGKIAFDVLSSLIGVGEVKALLKTGSLSRAALKKIQNPQKLNKALGKMPDYVQEGLKFENSFFSNLAATGRKVTRRVSIVAKDEKTGKVYRAVVDGVVKKSDGTFRYIETKLRKSTSLTKNQKVVYEALARGEAYAVGNNAKKAGLLKAGSKIQKLKKAEVKVETKFNN